MWILLRIGCMSTHLNWPLSNSKKNPGIRTDSICTSIFALRNGLVPGFDEALSKNKILPIPAIDFLATLTSLTVIGSPSILTHINADEKLKSPSAAPGFHGLKTIRAPWRLPVPRSMRLSLSYMWLHWKMNSLPTFSTRITPLETQLMFTQFWTDFYENSLESINFPTTAMGYKRSPWRESAGQYWIFGPICFRTPFTQSGCLFVWVGLGSIFE